MAEPTEWQYAPPSTLANRALLQRVVQSPSFAKSEKLARFLTFVCEMTLKGREREINEQKIGQAVFGRSRDYDSTVDGIVRTQASRVRQRLEQYFEHEGSFEPVRIVIPRGGYVPVFEPRAVPQPDAASVPEPEPLEPQPPRPPARPLAWRLLPWALSAALAAGLIFAILVQQGIITISAKGGPAAHPLWGQILIPGQPTTLIAADSGLVLYQQRLGKPVNLDGYLRGDYSRDSQSNQPQQDPQALITDQQYGRLRYTSVVDLEIAASLTQMATESHATIPIRYARDIRPNDLKTGNIILLGAAEANPWVELFERNMNYRFHDDFEHHIFSVYDQTTKKWWHSAPNDPDHHVYGVVAYLPNLSGQGNALILEGTSMAGTEAAWDFASDDAQLRPFLSTIRRRDGTIPHFEVLLENTNLSASALRSTILSWRVDP